MLVIGVDGLIGRALAQALAARGDTVVGTSRRPSPGGAGAPITLDLAASGAARTPLPPVDAAVICAAMARFADCREQPELARRVNVEAPVALAARLATSGARVVLLSTSAVFDCRTPHVTAEQPPSPRSAYGALKAEAEAKILALGARACVLRLTKVLTPDMPLFVNWIAGLRRGRAIEAFDDLTISPLRTQDVVAALLAVLSDRGGGIYQVSGAEDISYADAARHLARRLGVAPDLVGTTRAVDRGIPESEVTRYTSLDASRLAALTGWTPPPAEAVIDAVFGYLLGVPGCDAR